MYLYDNQRLKRHITMNTLTSKYHLTTLFLIFMVCAWGQSKKLVRQGLKETDPEVQISYFDKAIALDNSNYDAYFYRGIVKSSLEDHFEAILDFNKVLLFEPDADTFYNRGYSKFSLGDFKGAYSDYVMAINHDRSFLEAYFDLGITQFHLNKHMEALKSFNFLHSIFPNDVEIQTQIASTLMKLRYYKLAIIFHNKCVKTENNSNALLNRGLAYLEMKKYEKAKEDFKKALSKDKSNAPAYFYLGIAQLFSQEFDHAISSFENTLGFYALDHEALVGLAISYYHTNNLQKAKLHFNKAKSILTPKDRYFTDISHFNHTYWRNEENVSLLFDSYYNRLDTL